MKHAVELSPHAEACRIRITAPNMMEALVGSCLLIPCHLEENSENEPKESRSTGVWMKNNPKFAQYPQNVIFNSSRTGNNYPMNITGNLSQKNCTTLFSNLVTQYTDSYFFRIETSSFIATATCNPIQITVKGKFEKGFISVVCNVLNAGLDRNSMTSPSL